MSLIFSTKKYKILIRRPVVFINNNRKEITYYLKEPKVIDSLKLNNNYIISKYSKDKNNNILNLFKNVGFHFNNKTFKEELKICIPNGIHLIEHLQTGELASVMFSQHQSNEDFDFGGRISWLATSPKHRHKGLGKVAASLALNNLIENNYKNIWVTTHNHRLFAKKIFESIGFIKQK